MKPSSPITLYHLPELFGSAGFFCFVFFSKPLFTLKEKFNLKAYNSTLLDIYRISVGDKLKNLKRKENIIILKYTHK